MLEKTFITLVIHVYCNKGPEFKKTVGSNTPSDNLPQLKHPMKRNSDDIINET